MCQHRCILCGEMNATDPEYPCSDCVASDLAQEEETASALMDREEFLRCRNWDELTAGERAHYEVWLDDLA